MVPVYPPGVEAAAPQPHGALRAVWPGGLANPSALLTALRQERAVISGSTIDQVCRDGLHAAWQLLCVYHQIPLSL